MAEAPIPDNEEERLRALYRYDLLDRDVDDIFNTIIRIAADVCDVDICVIALIDRDRQFFLARHGMKPRETPRAIAFCAHAILEPDNTFEINDATKDPRFQDNPLVTGEIGVRFYVAQPLTTEEGLAIGGLCLIGRKPKSLNDMQRQTLINLRDVIMTMFEARRKTTEATNSLLKAKEAAEIANEAKTDFINTINHELRTPLTSLLGPIGLLLGGASGKLPDEAQSLLKVAYRNGEHLSMLIADMLDIQKIDANIMKYNIQPHDIRELIRIAVDSHQHYARRFNADLQLTKCPDNVLVPVDPVRFHQVMTNLISNACKHSPEEGRIEVSASPLKDKIVISVSDQGPGIPDNFKDRLFDKFTQAKCLVNQQHAGTGLGLSISREIIERHGGSINYQNNPGNGVTFTITLPAV